MAFAALVRAIIKHLEDPDDHGNAALFHTLKKEIVNDLTNAFVESQPLVNKYASTYHDSKSFLEFILRFCEITPPKPINVDIASLHLQIKNLEKSLQETRDQKIQYQSSLKSCEQRMNELNLTLQTCQAEKNLMSEKHNSEQKSLLSKINHLEQSLKEFKDRNTRLENDLQYSRSYNNEYVSDKDKLLLKQQELMNSLDQCIKERDSFKNDYEELKEDYMQKEHINRNLNFKLENPSSQTLYEKYSPDHSEDSFKEIQRLRTELDTCQRKHAKCVSQNRALQETLQDSKSDVQWYMRQQCEQNKNKMSSDEDTKNFTEPENKPIETMDFNEETQSEEIEQYVNSNLNHLLQISDRMETHCKKFLTSNAEDIKRIREQQDSDRKTFEEKLSSMQSSLNNQLVPVKECDDWMNKLESFCQRVEKITDITSIMEWMKQTKEAFYRLHDVTKFYTLLTKVNNLLEKFQNDDPTKESCSVELTDHKTGMSQIENRLKNQLDDFKQCTTTALTDQLKHILGEFMKRNDTSPQKAIENRLAEPYAIVPDRRVPSEFLTAASELVHLIPQMNDIQKHYEQLLNGQFTSYDNLRIHFESFLERFSDMSSTLTWLHDMQREFERRYGPQNVSALSDDISRVIRAIEGGQTSDGNMVALTDDSSGQCLELKTKTENLEKELLQLKSYSCSCLKLRQFYSTLYDSETLTRDNWVEAVSADTNYIRDQMNRFQNNIELVNTFAKEYLASSSITMDNFPGEIKRVFDSIKRNTYTDVSNSDDIIELKQLANRVTSTNKDFFTYLKNIVKENISNQEDVYKSSKFHKKKASKNAKLEIESLKKEKEDLENRLATHQQTSNDQWIKLYDLFNLVKPIHYTADDFYDKFNIRVIPSLKRKKEETEKVSKLSHTKSTPDCDFAQNEMSLKQMINLVMALYTKYFELLWDSSYRKIIPLPYAIQEELSQKLISLARLDTGKSKRNSEYFEVLKDYVQRDLELYDNVKPRFNLNEGDIDVNIAHILQNSMDTTKKMFEDFLKRLNPDEITTMQSNVNMNMSTIEEVKEILQQRSSGQNNME